MRAANQHWSVQRLSELVRPVRQTAQPADLPPETRYVGLKHVESKTGLHETVPLSDVDLRSGKFRFRDGDILFGKLRPNLRKVAVAQCTGVCSMDLLPLRPLHAGMSHLLAYQLRSREFMADVVRLVGGQNLPRVGLKDLLSRSIPVPPPAELVALNDLATLLTEAQRTARELNDRIGQLQDAATAMLVPRIGGDDPNLSNSALEGPIDELNVGTPDTVISSLHFENRTRSLFPGLQHSDQSAEVGRMGDTPRDPP